MTSYYTYAYLREDKTPYYIGRGKGDRAYRRHWRSRVRGGYFDPPSEDRIIILKKNLTEDDANKHEKYMIAIFGRKDLGTGILRNLTDGGEGTSNVEMTEERLMKLRKPKSEEHKNKLRKPKTEKHKKKLSDIKKGIPLSAEHKEKISKQVRDRVWWNNGINNKHTKECPGEGWSRGRINNNIGRVLSEETKEKIRTSNTGKTLTEEHKELLSQKIKGRKWWNNGINNKHTKECPGEGWIRGRRPVVKVS
jgi:hypothetical protein